ncbi:unnamed protein product [Chironomus riparius]|uniref:Uncharacterized protein n=1 Tax=Chironomus riparius TaxID=315576 RepID=A0A9N9S1K9_9DIPT|nr:unnamed protein product [Chironomus riparius]
MKFIIILFLVAFSSAVEFNCKFKDDYTCEVISGRIINKADSYVTGVQGDHKEGKSNKNVGVFDGRKVSIKYFPRNLNTYFPNIHQIFIERKLREITKEDLQDFPMLVYLYLSFNDIQIIEKDLFIYNPELRLVFLNENRIKYVDPNVFKNLPKLIYLGFEDNDCHSGIVEQGRSNVVGLIKKISDQCSNPIISNELELEMKIIKQNLEVIGIKKELIEMNFKYELCKPYIKDYVDY